MTPRVGPNSGANGWATSFTRRRWGRWRSEEHTSELQSRFDLVCRLLLEKKNRNTPTARDRGSASSFRYPVPQARASSRTFIPDSASAIRAVPYVLLPAARCYGRRSGG